VNLRDFWWEAQLTAAAGRSLAMPVGADREAAYLTGLLSQVGHLILCQAFAEELAPRLVQSTAVRGARLAQLEKDVCGLTYPEVGAAWMDTLGFPGELSQAVSHQLVPTATDGPLGVTLGLALCLGDAVREGLDVEAAWASVASFVGALPAGRMPATALAALHQGFESLHARLAGAGDGP
jgi:HD-like signal output (HDOD) protein